jgi:hypothetical protein
VEELQGVTDTPRKGLKFICEHAPEVGFDAVASYMGVDTRVLSGYMSSIGRRAPGLSTRFKRNYDKRVYRVPPESAGTILKALAQYQDVAKAAPAKKGSSWVGNPRGFSPSGIAS